MPLLDNYPAGIFDVESTSKNVTIFRRRKCVEISTFSQHTSKFQRRFDVEISTTVENCPLGSFHRDSNLLPIINHEVNALPMSCLISWYYLTNWIFFILLSVSCASHEFQCTSGYGCLLQARICDNYPQCLDGSDEDGCGTGRVAFWIREKIQDKLIFFNKSSLPDSKKHYPRYPLKMRDFVSEENS